MRGGGLTVPEASRRPVYKPVKSRTFLFLGVNVGSRNAGAQKPVHRVDVHPNVDRMWLEPLGRRGGHQPRPLRAPPLSADPPPGRPHAPREHDGARGTKGWLERGDRQGGNHGRQHTNPRDNLGPPREA